MRAETLRRKAILLGICILSLGGIVYAFVATSEDPRERYPDAPEVKGTWLCQSCGEVYELSPRDLYDFSKAGAETVMGQGDGSQTHVTSARGTVLRCPKCGEKSVRMALTCSTCGKIFGSGEGTIGVNCADCSKNIKLGDQSKKRRAPSTRRP